MQVWVCVQARTWKGEIEGYLRAVADIRKDNKVFHRIKIPIGSSKLNGLPWVLVTPCYQNRTLQQRRNTSIQEEQIQNHQELAKINFTGWRLAYCEFDPAWRNWPSPVAVVPQVKGLLSSKWIREIHLLHQFQVPVVRSFQLIPLSLGRCHYNTETTKTINRVDDNINHIYSLFFRKNGEEPVLFKITFPCMYKSIVISTVDS